MDEAPAGGDWLHEIKYDGYRMHARIDGELCALNDDGVPVFSGLQAAIDEWPHRSARLFAFDLLFGEATASLPLVERKAKLKRHFRKKIDGLLYTDHVAGADQPYALVTAGSGLSQSGQAHAARRAAA